MSPQFSTVLPCRRTSSSSQNTVHLQLCQSPVPDCQLRHPSFSDRCSSGLEESSSAHHKCVDTVHLLHSSQNILLYFCYPWYFCWCLRSDLVIMDTLIVFTYFLIYLLIYLLTFILLKIGKVVWCGHGSNFALLLTCFDAFKHSRTTIIILRKFHQTSVDALRSKTQNR